VPFLDSVSVLSVDDSEATRYARRKTLEAAGFSVRDAVNGLDALAIAREFQPTVAIVDVHLPDMDGFEVCRRLKSSEQTAGIAVLQISAMYASDEARVTALDGGADAYLSEPVDPKVLQATVNALARMRKAERDRERLYEELHAQAARLTAVVENTLAVIYVVDAGGRLQLSNRQFRKLFGDPPPGTNIRDLFSPEVAEAYLANNRAVLESGSASEFEETAIQEDGPHIYLSIKVPLFDAQGRATAICGISTDITRRKQAAEELRRSERRIRRLVDSNIVGVMLADSETILDANDIFLNTVGYTREDLQAGRLKWREMTPPEYREATDRAHRELLDRDAFAPFEKEYFRKDGSRAPILIGGAALSDTGERLCFVLDLSERKKTEAALREAQKTESLGFLAGGVAHNLNNLLVGIMGNVSLVQSEIADRPVEQERLEAALNSCERAAHLAGQMLAYAGKGRLFPTAVNLSALIERDLYAVLRGSIESRIDLRLELDPAVPELTLDSNQMRQVITNLVQNAAEAIDGREGRITVRTELRTVDSGDAGGFTGPPPPQGRHVVLTVQDTGSGMNDSTRSKIFDPFFSTKFTGRGLGLAAVAGIVRAYQGGIRVTSAPGRGSTFEVFLPVPESVTGVQPPTVQVSRARKRVALVVDDEPIVRQTVCAALERGGFTVLTAESGAQAVEVARQRAGEIDMVLLDLAMPGMDGVETLDRLREQRPDLPIAICSGHAEALVAPRFAGRQVQSFVTKPFTAQTILAVAAALAPE
jgi:two-component system cell cycle sensor histidine kinase/response regulator CckA